MKKLFLFGLMLAVLFVGCSESNDSKDISEDGVSEAESSRILHNSEVENEVSEIKNESENIYMKAVWLTQFDMMSIYRDGNIQRDKESFTALAETVIRNLKNDGYNTAIVQVRPYSDSFYPSEFYPISNYISGAFGNEDIYDPVEILIELTHKYGLEFHAWLNPLRAMRTGEIANVPDKYLIKQWYADPETKGKYIVELDGRLYLNPAYEDVRKLIADGAREVTEKYNIDGVHIDDYFYPTTDENFDSIAYKEYINNGGNKSLSKFRNEMLDLMVAGMYSAIKSVGKDTVFGISPAGNIQNTYELMYADVYKWCAEDGYLDYICPQIYFGLEHQTHDFKRVYNTWKSIIKNDNIRLIVGVTLGKAKAGIDNNAGIGKNEWSDHKDVLKRCFEYLATRSECTGVSVFCYQHMYDPLTGVEVESTQEERENMKNALQDLGKE